MEQTKASRSRSAQGVAAMTFILLLLGAVGEASADPVTDAQRDAQAAFDAKNYAAAITAANAGLAAKKDADALVFIKARALYEQGNIKSAWKVIQNVQPGRLPAAMQAIFEVEFSKIEAVEKSRVRAEKTVVKTPPPAPKKSGGLWKWLVAGSLAAAGGTLAFVGLDAMNKANTAAEGGDTSTYASDYDGGQTLQYVGFGVAAAGLGVGVWALLSSGGDEGAAGKQARSWLISPTVLSGGRSAGSGLLISGRF